MKNKEELSYKLTEGVKEDSLILRRAPGWGISAGRWQIEGSKFKVSLFSLFRGKGDAGEPLRTALTLTIKELTISVKHVFTAFTLYANMLTWVKVPFEEAQQESITERSHWNPPK